MKPTLKKNCAQLVAEAEIEIQSIAVADAIDLVDDTNTLFVDLRELRELQREGHIPGSMHVPRGLLEFWIDPDSPYYRQEFGSGKHVLFYCSLGWRSALTTKMVQDMGLEPVSHIAGGFEAWKKSDGPVEDL